MSENRSRPCPFVRTPFEECHISRMDSQSIINAVYYCAARFEECRIYRGAPEAAPEPHWREADPAGGVRK